MTTKKQLLERMIRTQIFQLTKKNRLNLKEQFDDDGTIWDELQSQLYDQLNIILQKWARNASLKLKNYAKNSKGELDYEELADEFFSYFTDNDYWDEAISQYK